MKNNVSKHDLMFKFMEGMRGSINRTMKSFLKNGGKLNDGLKSMFRAIENMEPLFREAIKDVKSTKKGKK